MMDVSPAISAVTNTKQQRTSTNTSNMPERKSSQLRNILTTGHEVESALCGFYKQTRKLPMAQRTGGGGKLAPDPDLSLPDGFHEPLPPQLADRILSLGLVQLDAEEEGLYS